MPGEEQVDALFRDQHRPAQVALFGQLADLLHQGSRVFDAAEMVGGDIEDHPRILTVPLIYPSARKQPVESSPARNERG